MKSRKLLAASVMSAALFTSSCSNELSNFEKAPTVTTSPEQMSEETAYEKRAHELWVKYFFEYKENFKRTGELDVVEGVCVEWPSIGGETFVQSPGFIQKETDDEFFLMFIFSGKHSGKDRQDARLMNGAYTYAKKDKSGELINDSVVTSGIPVFYSMSEHKIIYGVGPKDIKKHHAELRPDKDDTLQLFSNNNDSRLIFTQVVPDTYDQRKQQAEICEAMPIDSKELFAPPSQSA